MAGAPQFTPGPWLMGPSVSPGPRRVIMGPPIPGKPFQAALIAHVFSGIADDRLIAAAPELYNALDTAVRVLVENGLANGAIGGDCIAALAKARGEQ